MKILVIGLDCAAPEILLQDDSLVNFRRLMEAGCYGRLESVIPPITVPAWMCMATSQDPGSLGVYGFRNRVDHSYGGLRLANDAVEQLRRRGVGMGVAGKVEAEPRLHPTNPKSVAGNAPVGPRLATLRMALSPANPREDARTGSTGWSTVRLAFARDDDARCG